MRAQVCVVLVSLAVGLLFAQSAVGQTGTDPSINRPVSSAEIEQLKHEIADQSRSSVELVGDYHNESGDLNNRLDFWRYGAKLNIKFKPGALLYFSGVQTRYQTQSDFIDGRGTNFTLGLRGALSETADVQIDAGATRFNTDATTINALASLNFKLSDKSSLYLKGSRSNVEESLLSATGLRPVSGPFAGKLVGLVMDNQVVFGGTHALPYRFDVFAEGGAGNRTGSNIDSNFFKRARAGLGYNIVSTSADKHLSLLRASYGLSYFGFDKDLLGFGGVSLLTPAGQPVPRDLLGSDGISPTPGPGQPGVGGYFSPQYFVSNVGRLDVQGRDGHIGYRLSGFAGAQSYTGSPTREVNGVMGTLDLILSDRYSVPVTYLRDNLGPFTQQSLFMKLVVKF